MSFESIPLRPKSRRLIPTCALLAGALALTTACGHKKSPTPPPSKVPLKVELKVHQRGHEAILSFPFPTLTISGTLLPGISRVEIWRHGVEVPEFALELLLEEDRQRKEAQALLDELGLPLYEAVVAPVDPLAPPASPFGPQSDSAAADSGGALPDGTPTSPQIPDPAPPEVESPTETDAETPATDSEVDPDAGLAEVGEDGEVELTEEELLAQKVETARNLLRSPPTPKSSFISATSKDFKNLSELVLTIDSADISKAVVGDRIIARLALPARPTEGPEIGYLFAAKIFALNGKPSDFSALAAILPSDTPPPPAGVTVEAQPDGVHINWSADTNPEAGFRIYRRDAQTRLYGAPLATLATGLERTYVDRQAIFGARYIYGMTALESTVPLLESDLSSEHEIDYQDRFGPATPGGLVAFPEAGRVRLLWTAVVDADLAGYEISRRAPEAEELSVLNAELVTRGQYLDQSVQSGQVWFYSVVAIDGSGNRSPASIETQVRIP